MNLMIGSTVMVMTDDSIQKYVMVLSLQVSYCIFQLHFSYFNEKIWLSNFKSEEMNSGKAT